MSSVDTHGGLEPGASPERLRRLGVVDSARVPDSVTPRMMSPSELVHIGTAALSQARSQVHATTVTPRLTAAKVLKPSPSDGHTVESRQLDGESELLTPFKLGVGKDMRQMLEEIVDQRVNKALDAWQGKLRALTEEHRETLSHDLDDMSGRLEALCHDHANDLRDLHGKLMHLQGAVNDLKQQGVERRGPPQPSEAPDNAADLTEMRSELQALSMKVEELGRRCAPGGSEGLRNCAWQDLEARSPSPGGRSAKLEAARASRHGTGTGGRKSQGVSVPLGADPDLARRLSAAAAPATAGQVPPASTPSAPTQPIPAQPLTKQAPAAKLRRSASELPGQRLPLSPRQMPSSSRGAAPPCSNAATSECRQARTNSLRPAASVGRVAAQPPRRMPT